jgi:pheromone shutdown protein TraB
MIVECDKFINSNLDEILYIQDKNENLLILLGDYNYRGIENIVYSYNKQKLPERIIKKNKSFIVSYRFVFILFLVWIFVIFFFQKDKILKRLNNNQDLNMKANNKKNKSIVLEEDDF